MMDKKGSNAYNALLTPQLKKAVSFREVRAQQNIIYRDETKSFISLFYKYSQSTDAVIGVA